MTDGNVRCLHSADKRAPRGDFSDRAALVLSERRVVYAPPRMNEQHIAGSAATQEMINILQEYKSIYFCHQRTSSSLDTVLEVVARGGVSWDWLLYEKYDAL